MSESMMRIIPLLALPVLLNAADSLEPPQPKLQIINGSNEVIDIFNVKSGSARLPCGSVEPGRYLLLSATIGERYEAIGRDDKKATSATCVVPVQGMRFDPRGRDGVPEFYTQSASANGFPIVASAKVNPYALKEAEYIVNAMLAHRPDVREAMCKSGARLCIMAYNEYTTDLPEFAHLSNEKMPGYDMTGKDYWDARARGLGGDEIDPFCSTGEENLLGYSGDQYSKECNLIHEFAHNIHLRGMVNVDPTFDTRLKAAYAAAMKAGLWKGKYASVNHHEYFAVGAQAWFGHNRTNDVAHNHVNTRALLLEYDPVLASLCREVFGDSAMTYSKPATRLKDHLAGYDPAIAPKFIWPEHLQKVRNEIMTKALEREKAATANKP